MHKLIQFFLLAVVVLIGTGCASYKSDTSLMSAMQTGEFGAARNIAIDSAPMNPSDKSYLLGRAKVLLSSMADGVPQSTEGNADRLYDFLRTQGVNKGTGLSSVLTSESSATYWKGEPFEQAMGYSYIAAFDGTQGDWGNVRASSANSIFLIRDFSDAIKRGSEFASEESEQTDQQRALAEREAIIADAQDRSTGADSEGETGTDDGFEFDLIESDFELGYALQALASDQLGDMTDRDAKMNTLSGISSRFNSFVNQIRLGDYNTVVLVSYGLGPEKYGAGYDQVIEMYRPRTASGSQRLLVRQSGESRQFPVMTDVNRLAIDTRWTNFEGMRRAKSIVGTVMVGAGVAVIGTADSADEALVGGLLAIGGLIAKENAKADTRHCEILPQRTYIALLNLPEGRATSVEFEIEGMPQTRVVLPDVSGPSDNAARAAFHYVRLTDGDDAWRTMANPLYANDTHELPESTLPYILGGRCMRTPTPELMSEYHDAGLPAEIDFHDLMAIYQDEGIVIASLARGVELGRHISEGGNTLYTPDPCSVGYARLYCQDHPPYSPSGSLLPALLAQMNPQAE